MNRYLIDTGVCVSFLRGRFDSEVMFKRFGRENCFISEITLLELRYGAENSDDVAKTNAGVDAFIASLGMLPIFNSIQVYAKEKVRLRRSGLPLHDEFDMLIGATALKTGYTLVTHNTKHFARFDGIQLMNWPEAI